ncbi:MAG TPA: hypothetical protein DGG94_18250 [Micromonosporaceae bacterium]|nr:hypothetical protein [Micromonosporaceae bacterium]HCU51712.1 hypothetical protein [Micromonosporaceae bacterium]
MDRRRLLGGLALASTLPLIGGCKEVIEAVAESCPSDPAESGGVDWIPDVGHPLFWGVQELTTADGAPRPMAIYYPTHHGFTDAPPILKLCVTRWPVVLFLHGQPPSGFTGAWHRKFELLAAVLARSGYVVVAPVHEAIEPVPGNTQLVTNAMRDIEFARTQWSESEWVDKRPTSTAVMGHSFGALLGARVCAAHPEIGAFVSLSGGYRRLDDPGPLLNSLTTPSFFMWGQGDDLILLLFENLDDNPKLWDPMTTNKYAAVFQGEHFDYVRPGDSGSALRGPCSLIGAVAADLAALFISKHVPVSVSRTKIPIELRPPEVDLTMKQEFFAGGHLNGIAQFQSRADCRLDLRWKVSGVTGMRKLGP